MLGTSFKTKRKILKAGRGGKKTHYTKRRKIRQNRKPKNKAMQIWSTNLWQRSQECIMGTGITSLNGVGETGQQHAKE